MIDISLSLSLSLSFSLSLSLSLSSLHMNTRVLHLSSLLCSVPLICRRWEVPPICRWEEAWRRAVPAHYPAHLPPNLWGQPGRCCAISHATSARTSMPMGEIQPPKMYWHCIALQCIALHCIVLYSHLWNVKPMACTGLTMNDLLEPLYFAATW
jgi:hypothetical protein